MACTDGKKGELLYAFAYRFDKAGLSSVRYELHVLFYRDEADKRVVNDYGMMSEETLKQVIKRVMFQARGEVCFAFQGGEPTLRGIEFFEKALEFEQRFNRSHVRVLNTLQTNGYGIDEKWCRFFRDNGFLLGVSVDGTKEIHDLYRTDRKGLPTYEKICQNIELLEQYGVEFNILTVVTAQGKSALYSSV